MLVALSCSTSRHLGDGNYLLVRNKFLLKNSSSVKINTDELSLYIKQHPNKKVLYFFKFHLGVYEFADRLDIHKRDSGVYHWMKYGIGEEPVIYSQDLSQKSAKQIQKYLFNKGFFNAYVHDSLQLRHIGSKKVIVYYYINLNEPYKLNKVHYNIKDSAISRIVKQDTAKCLLLNGAYYNADLFEKERIRIEQTLLNDGYFGFSKDYIRYKIDSNMNNHTLNIEMSILSKGFDASHKEIPHNKYTIKNIYIYPKFIPLISDTVKFDTINGNGCFFLVNAAMDYKSKMMEQNIRVKIGELFQQAKGERTFQRFTNLKTFTYVNVFYREADGVDSLGNRQLDCIIQLTPSKMQSYSFETEGTSSSPLLGIGGNISYQHKNMFKGAELFNMKLHGALEFQNTNSSSEKADGEYTLFNTKEYGLENNLVIPKLFFPFLLFNTNSMYSPQTSYTLGYNYQSRKDYDRSILNVNWGGSMRIGRTKTVLFNLLEYNYVRIQKDSVFNSKVLKTMNPSIINSFQSHLIDGSRFSYTFNNQPERQGRSYWFYKLNIETAGNLLRLISPYLNLKQYLDGSYQLLGIRYAQYVRPTLDFRYFKVINSQNVIAFRAMGGVGYPYLNNEALPFEKSFFAGGANSIRAWRIYSLGPGSSKDTLIETKTGDMQIEFNAEYRFPIMKITSTGKLKGALFIDAGNIWMTHKDATQPGADFELNRFVGEMAIGAGVGFRFDFSFFVLRLDAAVKVRDPQKTIDQRWVINDIHLNTINLNLGIGYPF